MALAERTLGLPIDVISGHEEARLTFFGVAHELPPSTLPRLVIDIGGGSTEFIIGRGFEPERLESLAIGCVGMTQRFFRDGTITAAALDAAETAARAEIEAIAGAFGPDHWREAYGSSGTAVALADILERNGFSGGGITPAGLARLRRHMLDAGHVSRLKLDALKGERAPVLAGGLAIMAAAVAELRIERIDPVGGALRLGVLYDLLGRTIDEDARAATVERFIARYGIDRVAGRSRRRISRRHSTGAPWPRPTRRSRSSSNGRGVCTRSECRYRTMASTSTAPTCCRTPTCRASRPASRAGSPCSCSVVAAGLRRWRPPSAIRRSVAAVLAVRVAVLIHHARTTIAVPRIRLELARGIRFGISRRWLAAHPLTDYLLAKERAQWAELGYPWRLVAA